MTGTPEIRHGDIKAVSFKEKIHGNSSKSGSKTFSVSKAESVLYYFCGKNNHPTADCHTRTSEFTNHQNRPYVSSEAHGHMHSYEKFTDAMEYHNFYKLCLYYDLKVLLNMIMISYNLGQLLYL